MENIYEYVLIVLLIGITQLLKRFSDNSRLNSFITIFSCVYLTYISVVYGYLLIYEEISVCDFHSSCSEGYNGTINAYVTSYKTNQECVPYSRTVDVFYVNHKNGNVDPVEYSASQCTDSEYGCCYILTTCETSVQNDYTYSDYNRSLHEYMGTDTDLYRASINTKITKYDEYGESCPTIQEIFDDYEKSEERKDNHETFAMVLPYILIVYVAFCLKKDKPEPTKIESGSV